MKDSIRDLLKKMKKHWLPLWCAFCALMMVTMFAAAEYAATTSTMKKVVVSTSDQGARFSSNVLSQGGNTNYVPKYDTTVDDPETGYYDVDVFLWNYSLRNLFKFYPLDIDYKLKLTMTDSSGNTISDMGDRWVKLIKLIPDEGEEPAEPGEGGEGSGEGEATADEPHYTEQVLFTINKDTAGLTATTGKQTLKYDPKDSAEDRYKLRFSGNWDLQNDTEYCVQMLALLEKGGDEKKYSDLVNLGGIIGLRESRPINTGWQAYIAEETVDNSKTPSDYDAYNLVVTGSGQADIVIKWNSDKLICNRYFCDDGKRVYDFGTYTVQIEGEDSTNVPEVDYDSVNHTLTIKADSSSSVTNNRNRYDIQFYKADGSEPLNWNFFNDEGADPNATVWLSVDIEQK